MIDEIQKLLDQYLAWLRDKTALRQVKNWIEITTPYLDRHNDLFSLMTDTLLKTLNDPAANSKARNARSFYISR
jgi:hypothetical protein